MNVLCAKNKDSIKKLKSKIKEILLTLKKPFYAFNSDFERGSLFYHLSIPIEFGGELNKEKLEAKWFAVQTLQIPKDLSAQLWCKKQLQFSLEKGRVKTQEMQKGGDRHQDLHEEVAVLVKVEPKSIEDSVALKLHNSNQ